MNTTKLAAAAAMAAALAAGPAATAWSAPAPRIPFGPIGVTELSGPAGQVITLDAPISGEAVDGATPSGYWLVASDGGVFAEGGAPFYGSLPGLGVKPAAPVVGIVPTPNGHGYWLVGADGGVFAFGSAPFLGSAAGQAVTGPVTLTPTSAPVCGQTIVVGYRLAWAGGAVAYSRGVMCGAATGTATTTCNGLGICTANGSATITTRPTITQKGSS